MQCLPQSLPASVQGCLLSLSPTDWAELSGHRLLRSLHSSSQALELQTWTSTPGFDVHVGLLN